MERVRRQAVLSWLVLGLLGLLFCVLAVLQYRWIGEISRAERERLQESLQAGLSRLSGDFNSEIARASAALRPSEGEVEREGRESAYATRYALWRQTARHPAMFRSVSLAVPGKDGLSFQALDLAKGRFTASEWPAAFTPAREWMTRKLQSGGPGFPDHERGTYWTVPRFAATGPAGPATELDWLVVDLDIGYVRATVLPELIARHFGGSNGFAYDMEVVDRRDPQDVIYRSDPAGKSGQSPIGKNADASIGLFDPRSEFMNRPPGPPPGMRSGGGRRSRGFGGGGPPLPPGFGESGRGRWLLSARHQSGSLDAVVAQARWRNIAVGSGILLLMAASVATLLRFTRQAQRLADMQVEFVAGVSHELRTPLTVIRTAAYNLRGKLAANPPQVERYGKLIQDESEKLTAIIEQVMQFASAKAGRAIRERQPLNVAELIEQSVQSSRAVIENAGCSVAQKIDADLPALLGDSMALRHALQNLIQNAVKYGTDEHKWVGIQASREKGAKGDAIEIRVADRGPGIPENERSSVFEPFFRGERAVRDQIHGTGLGLNLVKQIVEAHGGSVAVESEAGRGTAFVIRIPAAPEQYQDEFAHTSG